MSDMSTSLLRAGSPPAMGLCWVFPLGCQALGQPVGVLWCSPSSQQGRKGTKPPTWALLGSDSRL